MSAAGRNATTICTPGGKYASCNGTPSVGELHKVSPSSSTRASVSEFAASRMDDRSPSCVCGERSRDCSDVEGTFSPVPSLGSLVRNTSHPANTSTAAKHMTTTPMISQLFVVRRRAGAAARDATEIGFLDGGAGMNQTRFKQGSYSVNLRCGPRG